MSLRLDGRLDQTGIAALDEHIETCANCRTEWETMNVLDSLFEQPPMAPVPRHFQANVLERIRRRDTIRRALGGGIVLTLGTIVVSMLFLSPLLACTLSTPAYLPVLIAGGPETASYIISYLASLGRTILLLLQEFVVPLGLVAAACMAVGAILNCALFGVLRRTRVRQ
jgi:anti-sigma factor RsiW